LIGHMIVQNTLHRPVRTFITVIAVAIEVTLVIIVVGLTSGMLLDSARRTEGVGADVMVRPPNSSAFIGFTGAPMPISIGDKLGELEHVQAVTPVLIQLNSVNALEVVFGIEPASFRAVSQGFIFHAGHDLSAPDDILVDDIYAKTKKVQLGQPLHILGHDFHVAGIVENGKGARLFVLMSTLEEMSGVRDRASVFFVKCDRTDHTAAAMDEIKQLLPNYTISPLKDYIQMYTSSAVPYLANFITVMISIAVAIGFLVTFLSMYTTIVERTREIGVLKSLGASKGYIIQVVMSEAALLCLAGFACGVGLSFLMKKIVISMIFPSLPIHITAEWIVYAGVIALAGGLFGALYPAWMASRKDPVEALAYE
jgi:putative ABC transport system permease protein